MDAIDSLIPSREEFPEFVKSFTPVAGSFQSSKEFLKELGHFNSAIEKNDGRAATQAASSAVVAAAGMIPGLGVTKSVGKVGRGAGTGARKGPSGVQLNREITAEASKPGRANVATIPPQRANDEFVERFKDKSGWKQGDPLPHSPYKRGTRTFDYVVGDEGEKFVRVHGGGNQQRTWLMRERDLTDPKTGRRLTPAELKDRFALSNTPEFVSDVTLPPGTRVRVGIANPHRTWGRGNGVQFEVLEEVQESWFKLRGPIE